MKTTVLLISMTMAISALAGCSSKVNREIDTRISQKTNVNTSADLNVQAMQTIETTPGLTDTQRAQLISLRDNIRSQLSDLNAQSIKLRSVLIEDVVSENNNNREVSAAKKRLKKVENKKLSVLFDGIDQADTILGKNMRQKQQVMDGLFDNHHF